MFILSDDKSAYGTLKGLMEALKKDAANAHHAMSRYGTRTLDYARAEGARGAYNLTISLITTTDIWQEGERTAAEATERPSHWHAETPTREYHASTEDLLRSLMAQHGLPTSDPFLMARAGVSVRHCFRPECLTSGKW